MFFRTLGSNDNKSRQSGPKNVRCRPPSAGPVSNSDSNSDAEYPDCVASTITCKLTPTGDAGRVVGRGRGKRAFIHTCCSAPVSVSV